MAKVTLTFEDNAKGSVDMAIDFDPPIIDADGDQECSYAQFAAMKALRAVQALSDTDNEEE